MLLFYIYDPLIPWSNAIDSRPHSRHRLISKIVLFMTARYSQGCIWLSAVESEAQGEFLPRHINSTFRNQSRLIKELVDSSSGKPNSPIELGDSLLVKRITESALWYSRTTASAARTVKLFWKQLNFDGSKLSAINAKSCFNDVFGFFERQNKMWSQSTKKRR